MSERLDCPISELPKHIRDYFSEEMDEVGVDLMFSVEALSGMGVCPETLDNFKTALFGWNELRREMISGSDYNFYDWNLARRRLYADILTEMQFVKDCVNMNSCSRKGCADRK